MGFYYGSSTPPPDDDKASLKDVIVLSLAVFRMLALPLGIMMAGGAYIVFVFFMFSMSPFAGYASLALIGVVVGSIYIWEKTHPPTLEE